MARKGINIDIASETRQFTKGVKDGVIEPLEDAAQALEEVAREGTRAGDKLEDAMRDAQRETEDLKRDTKELHDVIGKGSQSAYRRLEDSSRDAARRVSVDAAEMKQELKQNMAEAASSFTGDMTSAVDMVQGTLGAFAASIPGYGLALAGLGAAGGAVYYAWQENAQKIEDRVASMYEDMLESQRNYLSESYLQEEISKIVTGADDAAASMKEVEKAANATGMTQAQVLAAFAGDVELREKMLGIVKEQIRLENERMSQAESSADVYRSIGENLPYQSIKSKLEALNEQFNVAAEGVQLTNDAVMELGNNRGLAAQQARLEGMAAQAKRAQEALEALPSPTVQVNVDTSNVTRAVERLSQTQKVRLGVEFVTRDGRKVP